MAIPIPEYIKKIAKCENIKKTWLTISIHCECGCHDFFLYENSFTKEQEDELNRAETELENSERCNEDDAAYTTFSKFGIEKRITLYDVYQILTLKVYKVKCCACGNEHIIYDNRTHGYDAVMTGSRSEFLDFEIDYSQKVFKDKSPRHIWIKYENDESLEEFIDSVGDSVSKETYSNSFSWINIIAVNAKGKKTTLYEEETA